MSDELKKLKEHAEKNIIPFEKLEEMYEQYIPPVGDDPDFVVETDKSRIVYSIENQRHILCRHLSVSFKPGTDTETMHELLESCKAVLGFDPKMPLEQWVENGFAVNVLQPMLN